MRQSVKLAPPYSIIFVEDSDGPGQVPPVELPFVFNENCVVVCCYPADDGETEFTLADMAEVDVGRAASFEGTIKTCSGRIALTTAENVTCLTSVVPSLETRVKIWTNHPTMPDEVIIGFE